jgi:CRP-like cAMP-binding protein
MEEGRFHTEDIAVREITSMVQDEANLILLGQPVKLDATERLEPPLTEGFNFINVLNFQSLKMLKSSAIVTVSSIYNRLLIRDSSIVKKYWDIVIELILSYNVITTLFFLAYEKPGDTMVIIDFFTWLLFILDIFLTFFTEQITEKGVHVSNFYNIFKIYLKGDLVYDLIAIIPLGFGVSQDAEYYLRMVRLLKLPGVIDITDGTGLSFLLTYFSFGRREKNGKVSYSYKSKIIASLVKLLLSVIFIIYFLGCFFYWFQAKVAGYRYSSGPSSDFDDTSFHLFFGLDSMESKDVAIRCSYYILTTISTIGYGDFAPKNVYEMSFIIIAMLFGVTMFAYIMGNFNNAINFYNEATSGVDYIGELNTWLDSLEILHGKIYKDLRSKVIDHFAFYFNTDRLKSLAKTHWTAEKIEDLVSIDQDYVAFLPEEIYYKILKHLFSDFLYHFKHTIGETKLRYAIIPHLQPRKYEADELILEKDTHIKELVFVLRGSVSVGIDINGKHESLLFLEGGKAVLGDYQILTGLKNKFDYLAIKTVVAYTIDSGVFMKILEVYYKEEKNRIMADANIRESNLRRLLNDHLKHSHLDEREAIEIEKKYLIMPNKNNKEKTLYSEDLVNKKLEVFDEKTYRVNKACEKFLNLLKSSKKIRSTLIKIN